MANNENLIPIPGRLHSVATEGHVAGADEIYDDTQSKLQSAINADVAEDISDLQEIVGEGSVDTRIENAIKALDAEKSQTAGADGLALSVAEVDGKISSISGSIAANTYDSYGSASAAQEAAATDATTKVNAAKAELLGDAATDYNTLGKLEDAIQSEASTRETEIGTDSTAGSVKGRIKSLETLVGSTDVDSQIDAKINALDSTKSQTAGVDGLALSIEEEDGKIKSISGSIAANTYDAYGAASTAKSDLLGDAASDYNTLGKLEDAIQAEATTRSGETEALDGRLDNIEDVIPSAASSSNQLADKSFVNSSISSATAEYQGSYNSVSDLELTTSATHAQIATALGTEISGADNNDYCFVQIPTADATPTDIAKVERYKYNGTAWSFEYELNNSGYTDAQWAAINSGITSNLVTAFGNKYDKPSTGIPSTDMTSDVQTSLSKADTALQEHQDISGKADKTSTVSTVEYDGTNKKITKTINDTTTDVVSVSTLKTDLNLAKADVGLSNVGNFKAVSTEASQGLTDTEQGNARANIGAGTYSKPSGGIPASDLADGVIPDISGKANKSEMSVVDGTGTDADKTTITIKEGTSATVLKSHQDISGKQDVIDSTHKLAADLVDDTSSTNKFTNATEKQTWNAKQDALTFNTTPSADNKVATMADIEDATENCAYLEEDDSSAIIADFDPQTDTIWKKAQTLSNAEKSQVKTNLGLPQEIYSKTEVNELVSTPHQNYVTVATYSELPASGSTDTIYRVSNYDGTQVAAGVYSEYAWSGSAYVFLAAKSSVDEVFDISEYHAGAKYADLAAALDSNNGGGVPQSLQKGGMSVKFVSNSDNKYVKFFCTAQNFTTDVAQWQGVDDEPTAGSDNLIKSGGVEKAFENCQMFNFSKIGAPVGAILEDGSVVTNYTNIHLYSFDVNSFNGKTLIVNVAGLTDRQGAFSLLRFIDNNGTLISNVVLDNTFSSPVIGYKIIVPNNAVKLQIPSDNGILSVYYIWHDGASAVSSLVKYNCIFPLETNNLAKGSRFIGVLNNNGAVETPDSINTFYIANITGNYTFADGSSFALGENEFAIFNFTEQGIEKKKIISIDLYEDSDFYTNIINYSTLNIDKYVNSANGELVPASNNYASDYIEVTAGEKLILSSSITMWGAFYNSSKQFVSYSLTINGGGQANTSITVPSNAKYIRVTVSKANTTLGDEFRTKLYRQKERFKVNPNDISSTEILGDKDESYNLINPSSVVLNKRADGVNKEIVDDNTSKYVRFRVPYKVMEFNINIIPSSIAYSIAGNGNTIKGSVDTGLSFNRPNDAVDTLYFYLNYPKDTDISTLACYPMNANGYYYSMKGLRVPYLEKNINDIKNELNNIPSDIQGLRNQWQGKKILWLGTSIPWGQSDEENPGTTTRVAHPYPQQVCDALGATLIDSTHGGLAQQAAYDENSDKWYPKPYNSTGGTTSGGSTCLTIAECQAAYAAGLVSADLSAYSYENTLLGKNADLYIFDVEPNNNDTGSAADLALFDWRNWKYTDNSTFVSHRNTYIGALIYEIDQLLTEKPDAVVLFIGEYIPMGPTNYDTPYGVREQTMNFCDKFHIGYINIAKKLFYVGKNKSVWVNTDNTHPKQAAYNRMAKMLINELLLIA